MNKLSIQRTAEGILGVILQAAAVTIAAALALAGWMHPEAVAYVLQSIRGPR